ncbi:leucine--tRNA ligase [Theileria orientalis]|uniref:leucine--tRNA ligase n=1 Tax=Theileria orientalis TaxID=68886 RepID=A0A976MBN4_THEOR|nr:leucine--tRNA ligase [Theileria orientalis]
MIWVYVRNAILIYTWIRLFECGISASTSIRSKKSLRIFSSGVINSNTFDLVGQLKRNLSFVHTYSSHRGNFDFKKLINTKEPLKLRLVEEIEDDYHDFEYNFPRYETKWQKFWDETKLFSTEEIDIVNYKVKESEANEAKQARFRHQSAVYRVWNPDVQINDYLLTHSQNVDRFDNKILIEDEEVCDYSSLSSESRYSNPFLSGTHGEPNEGAKINQILAKNDKEDLRNTEGIENRQKYYILAMIPYPSGKGLHVGHLLGYTAVDVVARYKRLNNYHVLNPIGFDCFGIPTEIYSEKVKKTPQEVTSENVRNFRKQLKSMGFSFDFSREVLTSDIEYYKWTQWIFQNMFLKGLAYLDKGYVNYCPALKSELSNEEIKHGKSVRGDYDVYKKLKTMWKLRITDYAKRLYDDLSLVDYPEKLINLQKNWIGPKQGYLIRLRVEDERGLLSTAGSEEGSRYLYGFIDDLARCAHMESVEVPILLENVLDYCSKDKKEEVSELLEESLKMSNVELSNESNRRRIYSGMSAVNPYDSSKVPIYVTNSLINTNKKINCKINVEDSRDRGSNYCNSESTEFGSCDDVDESTENMEYGKESINSITTTFEDETPGKSVNMGVSEQNNDPKEADWYKPYLYFNIRDWEFSRNRGWGEPIPVSLKEGPGLSRDGKSVYGNGNTSEEHDLEYKRNDDEAGLESDGDMNSKRKMLEQIPLVLNEKIKETMPQWAGSSWHYLRFVDPNNKYEIFNKKIASYWLPVDLYIGGVEHAVSHLLYSRFWNKFLYDIKVSPVSEPFKKIILHGVIKTVRFYIDGKVYNGLNEEIRDEIREYKSKNNRNNSSNSMCDNEQNAVLREFFRCENEVMDQEEVEVPPEMVMKYKNKYVMKGDRSVDMKIRMKKMSKSRGNVINPEEIIRKYGSDTLRLHLLFLGPIEKDKIWSTESINGVYRLLRSIYSFYTKCLTENGYGKISANGGVHYSNGVANAFNGGERVGEYRFDDDLAVGSTNKSTQTMYSSGGISTSSEAAIDSIIDREVALEVNKFIHNVTRDLENVKLNKISEFFSFLKKMQKWHQEGKLSSRVLDIFLVMLSPFAPHLTEELWYMKYLNSVFPNDRSKFYGEGKPSEDGGSRIDKNYRSIALERWPEKINVL